MSTHAQIATAGAVCAAATVPAHDRPAGSALAAFERAHAIDPHRTAVLDDRGNSLTRAELAALSAEVATELQGRGLGAGDVVILCMPNWTEWLVVYLAVLRLRMIPATLPVTTDAKSIAYVANLVGAKAIALPVTHRGRDFRSESSTVAREFGHTLHVLLLDGDHARRSWRSFDGPAVTAPAYPADMAHILFSSSTTGKSKAIAHSEASLSAYNFGVIDRYQVTDSRPIFMPSPLGHSTGLWHGARMSLLTGATLVLQDRWKPRRALELIDSHGCGITVAATPFLKDLVDCEWDGPAPKLNTMRAFLCGGAPVPPELIERARRQMPHTFISSIWAMSEGGATSSVPGDAAELVSHTCGRVLPGVVLETIAPDGSVNPRGTEGELVMRTPSLFIGYLGQDDLYRESFTADGFFRTGDLGVVDDAGYLRLTGRLKDLIIRGGINISPVEIEYALSDHDQVAKVAVVGRPDSRLGERICAVIQPRDTPPTFEELVAWLERRGVPRRLWPESVHIVAEMPQTPAGKIRKAELKQELWREWS
ncbi:cyclohexanecarboxylate-CoA ligase [Mycolicibacterium litorale]|uniref:Cyclohexanecarboxylate-CoA ligase n=1 Tax=Mycolicibacterium litorale TaxID=758802 RepID=A0A6S6P3E2_9MYCO|nr:AMP-binding protein [Mycolicibacterium litorale]BCI53015.1 cyclohexanecarboxylate-CoA ligase [Mycolicibacterium litorale]